MKFVFLDTSVFIKYNYLDNPVILSLINLSKNQQLKWLTTDVLRHELLKNFEESLKKVSISVNSREFSIIKNVDVYKQVIHDFSTEDILDKFRVLLEKTFTSSLCVEIPNTFTDINSILNKYFEGIHPFDASKKNKKAEFPDAITLSILENYAVAEGIEEIYVFAQDKDLINYKSDVLKIDSGDLLPKFLSEEDRHYFSKSKDRIDYLNNLISDSVCDIKTKIGIYLNDLEVDEKSLEAYLQQIAYKKKKVSLCRVFRYAIDSFNWEVFLTDGDSYVINFITKGIIRLEIIFNEDEQDSSVEFSYVDIKDFTVESQGRIIIPFDDLSAHSDFEITSLNYGNDLISFYELLEL